MAELYSEEIKEKWVMFFLLKYDHFRPARLSKDKINTSIAKFWDNDLFWDAFLKNFNLLDLAPGSKVPDNIHQAVTVFWSIIKDGLNYEEKRAKAKEKAEAKHQEYLATLPMVDGEIESVQYIKIPTKKENIIDDNNYHKLYKDLGW